MDSETARATYRDIFKSLGEAYPDSEPAKTDEAAVTTIGARREVHSEEIKVETPLTPEEISSLGLHTEVIGNAFLESLFERSRKSTIGKVALTGVLLGRM